MKVRTYYRLLVKHSDPQTHCVYGWASIAKTREGKYVVDSQKDIIDVGELEHASSEFVKQFRQGGEMHEGRAPNELIASLCFTPQVQKALGIPEGVLPQGWFVGFEIPTETFKKVASGSMLMFSIEGEGDREPVELADSEFSGVLKAARLFKLMGPDAGTLHTKQPLKTVKGIWDAAYINKLPDNCFAVIGAGGKKDQTGKTTPRSLRHLPFRDKTGKVDLPHLRNALSRLPQTKLSSGDKAKARARLTAAARSAGVGQAAKRQVAA